MATGRPPAPQSDAPERRICAAPFESLFPFRQLQARRDSNPQPSVLETDALPIRATGLDAVTPYPNHPFFHLRRIILSVMIGPSDQKQVVGLFGFTMNGALATKPTIFLSLKSLRRFLLIFSRCIISAFAIRTR